MCAAGRCLLAVQRCCALQPMIPASIAVSNAHVRSRVGGRSGGPSRPAVRSWDGGGGGREGGGFPMESRCMWSSANTPGECGYNTQIVNRPHTHTSNTRSSHAGHHARGHRAADQARDESVCNRISSRVNAQGQEPADGVEACSCSLHRAPRAATARHHHLNWLVKLPSIALDPIQRGTMTRPAPRRHARFGALLQRGEQRAAAAPQCSTNGRTPSAAEVLHALPPQVPPAALCRSRQSRA